MRGWHKNKEVKRRTGTARKATLALVNVGKKSSSSVFFSMQLRVYVRDEYGGQKIRVRPLDKQAPHQLPKIRKINVAFRSRTLKPDLVSPMRIEEHAKEKNVQQTLAPPP